MKLCYTLLTLADLSPVFDYIEGGAGSESTVRANQREVEAVQFPHFHVGEQNFYFAPETARTDQSLPCVRGCYHVETVIL